MFKKILFSLMVGAVFVLTSAFTGSTAMASIHAVYSGNFDLVSGTDGLGLNGASFTLTMDFDENGVYINRFSFPAIDSDSHSFQVSGSSNDGTYFEADQMGFYPTFGGQFFGGGSTNGLAEFLVGGQTLFMQNLVDVATGTANIGDTIAISDFGSSLYAASKHFDSTDGSEYEVTNFTSSVALSGSGAVPEPGTIAIWSLFAGAGLTLVRRRKA